MKSNIIFVFVVSTCLAFMSNADDTTHVMRRAAESDPQSVSNFCWRDSYGRGIGKVPQSCPSGQTRIGLLCYPNCPSGYSRFGFDCHSRCPADFRDDGLFCRNAEYGRGAGYPWKFGDGFNDRGMYKRCEARQGKGKCEKYGAIVYPKCRSGYHNVGCCICRPAAPNCNALGLNNGIGLSCAKKIIIGEPSVGICGSDEERDAGLCYKKCRSGFNGIGPVCWGGNPSGWVGCGMGAARNGDECASALTDQIVSVGEVALFVASLGTSTTAQGLKAPAKAADVKKLKEAWDKVKSRKEIEDAIDRYETAYEVVQTSADIEETLSSGNEITTEDYIRMAATISSILDPSGVSSVVAAYSYPKCDKIIG